MEKKKKVLSQSLKERKHRHKCKGTFKPRRNAVGGRRLINLIQNSDQWRVLVDMVMNIPVP